jgi:hypothetical protein
MKYSELKKIIFLIKQNNVDKDIYTLNTIPYFLDQNIQCSSKELSYLKFYNLFFYFIFNKNLLKNNKNCFLFSYLNYNFLKKIFNLIYYFKNKKKNFCILDNELYIYINKSLSKSSGKFDNFFFKKFILKKKINVVFVYD